MKIIKSLTKAQEKQIPKYIEKYLKFAEKPTDRNAATKAVQALYENAGFEKPIVIFGQSPFQTTIMTAMCKILFKNDMVKDDSQLRSQLCSHLGSQLDSQLRSQLGSQLDGQLCSHLGSQLYSQLYSQLDSQLDSQLYSQLDSQLRSHLGSQLYSQLYSQLDSQLRSQLDGQLNKINNDWWLVVWWLAWAAWYSFGEYIGVKFDTKIFKIFTDFVTNVSFIIPYKGIAFVSETPEKINWEDRRLGSSTEPAVKYADGYSLYSIRGVSFEKELWEKVTSGTMSAKEVFAIQNMEQRRIAYELMDKKKMLDLGAEVLDEVKDDGYGNPMKVISFKVEGFNDPFIYLNCFCPSTGREYFLQTNEKTCAKAKAKSFGLEEITFSREW